MGLKEIPLSLKFVCGLFVLWTFGSLFAIPMRYEQGVPFFGLFLTGVGAITILALLDVIGPLVFLVGVWTQKQYGLYAAYVFMSVFIINSLFALVTVRDQLGADQIIIPAVVYGVMLGLIHRRRDHFSS